MKDATGSAQDLHIKDSDVKLAAERTNPLPVAKVGSTSKEDFVEFLRDLLDGRTTDWKTARTAEDALVRHQAVLDAMSQLDDLGWAKTGGGFQVPEGRYSFEFEKTAFTVY